VAAEPGSAPDAAAADALPEALTLARAAAEAGIGLKLLGGLAVRVLVPGLPPRVSAGQDMDFACLSKGRKATASFLEQAGCVPDRRFNNLNGDRQMYFTAPSGRPVDVMVDRLSMCHVLDFRSSYGRQPLTLDAVDILLSKLQIVELNEKDVRDILQLLAGLPLRDAGDAAPASGPALDCGRFAQLLAADWGWWRTVTGSLAKLPGLAGASPALIPPDPPHDPLDQAARLAGIADSVPKGMKWKLRANVGDRVRWYELPEEAVH
jgi:hypothetical protein